MDKLLYTSVKVITKLQRSDNLKSSFLCELDVQNKLIYCGYLKAYDPLTKSIILCHIKNDKVTDNILILSHAVDTIISNESDKDQGLDHTRVEAIIISDLANKCKYNLERKTVELSDEDSVKKASDIIDWLSKNRIPAHVEEGSNEIIIADDIRVLSPYKDIQDYKCPTRIILKRIKTIIDSREIHVDSQSIN